jgi:hypothetical protein
VETKRNVTLSYNEGKDTLEMPVLQGTLGPDVVDIRTFSKTGMFTFDPGFLATASCESGITFIDGDLGQLYYRGYEDAKSGKPLDEDLAELSDDYFHGYDQFKYYHIAPQGSAPQSLYDIKPNSNNNSRMTQGEADRGLNELTDGHSFATASNDNLKEAVGDPLGFAHALEEATQIKRQRSRELAMNMAWMTPDEDEDAPKRPRFNPGKFTDTHQELPVGTLSSKLPFPTDVIKTFFED